MAIKPSTHGIVVDNKESGLRYAVSDENYDSHKESKVRDLKPGETVIGYQPKLSPNFVAEEPRLSSVETTATPAHAKPSESSGSKSDDTK
jgi:hypothetical protein